MVLQLPATPSGSGLAVSLAGALKNTTNSGRAAPGAIGPSSHLTVRVSASAWQAAPSADAKLGRSSVSVAASVPAKVAPVMATVPVLATRTR